MVASSNISTFRSKFKGGSRPNRFEVTGKIPTKTAPVDIDKENTFLIKASTMPPSTVGIIPVPYRGRILKVPGDRLFIEWDIVVIDDPGDDPGSDLRNKFIEWSHLINKHAENTLDNQSYYADWNIYQLEHGADKKLSSRKITLHNCWPVEISGIEFTHDVPNTLVQWNVRMAYDFWTNDAPTGPKP